MGEWAAWDREARGAQEAAQGSLTLHILTAHLTKPSKLILLARAVGIPLCPGIHETGRMAKKSQQKNQHGYPRPGIFLSLCETTPSSKEKMHH